MLQEAIEERDQNNKDKWMLDPNSKYKTTWDIGLITRVLYTALMSMCEMTRKWYTVRATTNCHFYRITQEDMNEIFIDFPEYARSVRGKA